MGAGLAARLREETHAQHMEAERSDAMRALLTGRMPRETYARLLRALHPIYAAMEIGLATHADRPALAWLPRAALARTPALARDLAHVSGDGWETSISAGGEAAAYAAHIGEIAAHDPDRLLAHAYVRYLGDLSGGAMLGRAVAKAFGATASAGAAFYDFPDVPDANALKREFRTRLDDAPVDDDAIVDEARWVFSAHARLFAELMAKAR